MSNFEIYFDEKLHKYTDSFKNAYTSVTTVIGQYEDKFSEKEWDIAVACERIGRNPSHPKYNKYKGKRAKQIIAGWRHQSKVACETGNKTHNFLEDSIKLSTKYKAHNKQGRLFTIKELIDPSNINLGLISLKVLEHKKVDKKYPEIFKIIKIFSEKGWRVYSEICTYNYDLLVSGLIDILLIKDNKFIILDWKTNKAPLQFESGYYNKDMEGNIILSDYITTNTYFKYPLNKIQDSTGNKYTLQLSSYAYLTEQFGLELEGIILCHIRHDKYTKDHKEVINNPTLLDKQVVDFYNLPYLKEDVSNMYKHFSEIKQENVSQYKMFA